MFICFFVIRDVKKLPRENLEVLLELEGGFPSPISTNRDDINVGCGICYSFRFEGQVPDQLCSHTKCQQPFHRACLYEVLATGMYMWDFMSCFVCLFVRRNDILTSFIFS